MTDPTPAAAPPPSAPFTPAEDKQYSTLATFLNIIPLIPGLIFYFAFKDRGPAINKQSRENLNWTITITGAYIILLIIGFATLAIFIGILFILLAYVVLLLNLIFSIIGGTKANVGEFYSYPFSIKFIK